MTYSRVQRVFGGKRFTYLVTKGTKKEAQKEAQEWRRKGALARVVKVTKFGRTNYEVWARSSK